jgi:hypothetical protein
MPDPRLESGHAPSWAAAWERQELREVAREQVEQADGGARLVDVGQDKETFWLRKLRLKFYKKSCVYS